MQTLLQSINQYLEMCEYERNLSEDTIKAYRIDLRQFSEFTEHEWADCEMLNQYIIIRLIHIIAYQIKITISI